MTSNSGVNYELVVSNSNYISTSTAIREGIYEHFVRAKRSEAHLIAANNKDEATNRG